MKITLLTYGSRGDVEPFFALADGLIERGHDVTLSAPGVFNYLVYDDRLHFHGLPGDPGDLAQGFREYAGGNYFKMVSMMIRHVVPIAIQVYREVQIACQGAEAIVHSFLMTEAGHTMASEYDALDISAQLFPVFVPTAVFPSVVFPDLPLGSIYRRLTHALTTLTFNWGGRLSSRFLLRRAQDLPDLVSRLAPWPFSRREIQKMLILFGISQHVLPRPDDWPDNAILTGYWQREVPGSWQPPEDVVAFLSNHEKPIFFSLGSMHPTLDAETIDVYKRVSSAVGRPAIISVQGGEGEVPEVEGDTLLIGSTPYAWLLPRVGTVVHHGGAGTSAAVMRAGVPGVVTPVSADQFFWARRIHRLGLSPEPLPHKKMREETLIAALRHAISDSEIKMNVEAMAEKLASEDGVANAVAEIERAYESRRESS